MNNSLVVFVNQVLPQSSGSAVVYDNDRGLLRTATYTAAAGNTYYQGINISNRLIIKADIGEGHTYTFLNGVTVYAFNGNSSHIIGSWNKTFPTSYSPHNMRCVALHIVLNYLLSQAAMRGNSVSESEVNDFAEQLVDEAMRNCIAA